LRPITAGAHSKRTQVLDRARAAVGYAADPLAYDEPPLTSAPPPRGAVETVAHVLAVWFGCGHVPRAPGTAGTLGAIPLYLLLRPHGVVAIAIAAVLITVVGVWASRLVCLRVERKDPQIVVIDEVAGVLIAWAGAPLTPTGAIAGFVLFRVFDHLKPWPARVAERQMPIGYSVMFDDVVAGLWAALILFGAHRFGVI
jgi:phosphatidylglycerophosphatase A